MNHWQNFYHDATAEELGHQTSRKNLHKVHLWANGHYGGFYEYDDLDEAWRDLEDRTRQFGPMGYSYKLEEAKPTFSLRPNPS